MTSAFADFNRADSLLPDASAGEEGGAFVYLVDVDDLAPADHDLFAAWLDPGERERKNRFASPEARELFVVAHGFARFALSHWLWNRRPGRFAPPGAWRFRIGEFGKPEAFDPDAGAAAPAFSLSHTRGAAAVAVADRGRIGVDIEALSRTVRTREAAERYLAPEERDDVLSLPDAGAARERLLLYWTLKEAYLKALGFGLTKPLAGFSFLPGNGRADLRYDVDAAAAGTWFFRHFRSWGSHVVSVARDEEGVIHPMVF